MRDIETIPTIKLAYSKVKNQQDFGRINSEMLNQEKMDQMQKINII